MNTLFHYPKWVEVMMEGADDMTQKWLLQIDQKINSDKNSQEENNILKKWADMTSVLSPAEKNLFDNELMISFC